MKLLVLKKTAITIMVLLLGISEIHSQMGCTDPLANNYDPSATQNDGSCTYDPVTVSTTNTYALDAVLAENSGLIYWNDNLWTQNDSSDTNLYELDPSNGSILASVSLDPLLNEDWEEISQDEDYVYVGDFGNNANGNRTDLKIIRVSKVSIQAGTPQMDIINFAYEDQTDFTPQGPNNTNYDCEAFIVTESSIFLFTKEWVSNETRLYKLPKIPGTYQALLQEGFDVNGLITGAVYKNDRGIIALSGYSTILQPFVFLLYDYTGENFLGGNKRKLGVSLPFHQVEGITTADGLNYYISNERFNTTGTIQQLHTLNLTPYLENYLIVIPIEDSVQFKIYPNPTTSILEIMDSQSLFPIKYTLVDTAAKKVREGTLTAQNPTIDVSALSVGTYILRLGQETSNSFRVIKK
ncbi:T9SS type A sorting domain-containing protein [Aequorivita lipolytica]|uniref:T9SS type A sorting domain-containing protein n=1 Tax=Aequorivita lipolytica TaxID=153267 RepID=A0A5C6YMP3_9FLAO|nr:T9SS type A sorting domain-containing protein [Aequorivita lipolytica]TXD68194.1 T9SS type A sorting domain-containing protein [Aequorivita lipolytica]SRX53532.1 hypothetical protein AEQU2_02764 [Aequorivita lipolytica]